MSQINSADYSELNKVIGWYILLRWVACAGICVVLCTVQFILSYSLLYPVLYGLNFFLVLLNIIYSYFFSRTKNTILTRHRTYWFFSIQIVCDYLILFLLIYFAGFLENPFLLFFIFHIILTSFIFSQQTTYKYTFVLVLAVLFVSFLVYLKFIPYFSLNVLSCTYNDFYRKMVFPKTLGLISGLVISAYLVTEIKNKIEAKGKKAALDLERYKNIDKMKSDFILQVTHELRGPLAAIKGYHEIIQRGLAGEINQDVRTNINKANYRTENLLTMVGEMIDYAYMKTEEAVKYRESKINLKTVLDYNLDLFQQLAKRKNVRIVSSCPLDINIIANRDLLNIIFNNLLSNAIKYTRENRTIYVNLEKINQELHLMVKDEGIGIEPENLEKIFDEFYRTPEAKRMEKDGTGLGLAIVKKVVSKLHGQIEVYSEKDKGSAFHIFLKPEFV